MSGLCLKRAGALLAAAWLMLAAAPLAACNVPVFRYALERWAAEPYEVVVFHRGPLPPEASAAVVALRDLGLSTQPDARFFVRTVDLDAGAPASPVGADEDAEALWQTQAAAALPWMVLRYPATYRMREAVWAAPLTRANVEAVADSPARQEVARRIVAGESGVFVLLESGQGEKDRAALERLTAELARLETELELPAPPPGEWGDPRYDTEGAPELRLAFSVVRVSRADAAEAPFVAMLLRSESDLVTFDEPMVFPVFGRGRVLWALVGGGINRENIAEVCEFLVGPCSCIVKDENPGTDLLMTVDWDAALAGEASAIPAVTPPPLAGLSDFVPGAKEAQAPRPEAGAGGLVATAVLAVLGGLAILAVAVVVGRKAKSRRA